MATAVLELQEVVIYGENGCLVTKDGSFYETNIPPGEEHHKIRAMLKILEKPGRKFFIAWTGDSNVVFNVDGLDLYRDEDQVVDISGNDVGHFELITQGEGYVSYRGFVSLSPQSVH
jgi:hypothetical protein